MHYLFAPEILEQRGEAAELLDLLIRRLAAELPFRRLYLTAFDRHRRLAFSALDLPEGASRRERMRRGILPFPGPILPRAGRPIHSRLRPLFERMLDIRDLDRMPLSGRAEFAGYPHIARSFEVQLRRFGDQGYRYSVPLILRGEVAGFLFTGEIADKTPAAKVLAEVETLRRPLATILRNFYFQWQLETWQRANTLELDRLTAYLSERRSTKARQESGLVYRGRRMARVLAQVREWAGHDYPVLIQGETGTGKELVARSLQRRSGYFVAVNCGAIPESLWEAEVFGYRKGAFTDARRSHRGFIEQAGEGCLFFDEIGEMPASMQSKMLRLLQDGSYRPIGSERNQRARCRFLFATNRDLEEEVRRGNFREDLYYRISVFQIALPPLRRRREDLPGLVDHILRNEAGALGSSVQSVSPELLRILQGYAWPGNVRELQNVLIRSMAGSTSAVLDVRDVGRLDLERLRGDATPVQGPAGSRFVDGGEADPALPLDFKERVDEYRRSMLLRALQASGGNKRRAATLLGLSPQTFDYQLRSLAIEYVTEVRPR